MFEAEFNLLIVGGLVFRLEVLHGHSFRLYLMAPTGQIAMQVSETGRFCHSQIRTIIGRNAPSFDTVYSVFSELLDMKSH